MRYGTMLVTLLTAIVAVHRDRLEAARSAELAQDRADR